VTELRKHPKVLWPPQWSGSCGPSVQLPVGEEGILVRVQRVSVDPNADARVQLRVAHNGNTFWSYLQCEDAVFLSQLYQKLKQCLGQPLDAVGSLDV
jgi:hypothetical protein